VAKKCLKNRRFYQSNDEKMLSKRTILTDMGTSITPKQELDQMRNGICALLWFFSYKVTSKTFIKPNAFIFAEESHSVKYFYSKLIFSI